MFLEVPSETLDVPLCLRTAGSTGPGLDPKGLEHPFEIGVETDVPLPVIADHQRLVVVAQDFGRAAVASQARADAHHPRRLRRPGADHDEPLVRPRIDGLEEADLRGLEVVGKTKFAEGKVDLQLLTRLAEEGLVGRRLGLEEVGVARGEVATHVPSAEREPRLKAEVLRLLVQQEGKRGRVAVEAREGLEKLVLIGPAQRSLATGFGTARTHAPALVFLVRIDGRSADPQFLGDCLDGGAVERHSAQTLALFGCKHLGIRG